ncbi:MAG: molybdopterin-dependent oxidoreductase [Chloroflexi bacterium]|jgi:predicted molibdopterin-dependent oxidoreductase YjgC|nr:molybdopterin-dependent oxidoreductase [Chloroflexota bacterium]MBT4073025.1 molybdopterin-dependent oxidoreductase [Chloroflexota bacterium]MBT6681749.1 molybdopterin-dependent oxidoreductase [Chloroflexota bacterium]
MTSIATEAPVDVNGVAVPNRPGGRVLAVLRDAGASVPTLCYDDRLEPQGTCRMCLVEVEMNGRTETVASCTAFSEPGMKVRTHTKEIVEYRKTLLELLLSEVRDPAKDSKRAALGDYEFQAAVREYGAEADAFRPLERRQKVDDPNPFIARDYDMCIACFRCTNICNDWEQASAITVAGRGQDSNIFTKFSNLLMESPCTFCGQCVNTCPTGALTNRKLANAITPVSMDWEGEVEEAESNTLPAPSGDAVQLGPETAVERTKTICPYCGVGCGINLITQDGELVGSEPDFSAPSQGSLCVKGQFGSWDFINSDERLTTPIIKNAQGEFEPASWDEALTLVTDKFKHYRDTNGPDSTVFWSSARTTSESNYLAQKFARVALETNNIDNCSRT